MLLIILLCIIPQDNILKITDSPIFLESSQSSNISVTIRTNTAVLVFLSRFWKEEETEFKILSTPYLYSNSAKLLC